MADPPLHRSAGAHSTTSTRPRCSTSRDDTGAIPFDIEGVEISHEGERCSFDTMLKLFGLEGDPHLAHVALIVRGADTARPDLAPEAAGLHAISLGLSALAGDDDHGMIERGFVVYDALLAWSRHAARSGITGPRRPREMAVQAETMRNREASPSFGEAFRLWLKIGCINFGGPAGQIAMMHRMLVDEKKWIDEPRFLHALNFCMLLPGPEAQKLATYIGWALHGVRGGLVAGILFVLPGALVMLGLEPAYALGRGVSWIDGALFGIKAAVLVIVVEALIRIGKRALKTRLLSRSRARHSSASSFSMRRSR